MPLKQIVCLSYEPWSNEPGRTQHLMTRLKDAQVLWFQPAEGPFDRRWRERGQKVRTHVTVYTLPPERTHHLPWKDAGAVCKRQGLFIAEKLRRHRFRECLVWCTSPEQVNLLEYFEYTRLIYDCHRDWPHFPIEWESELTLQSDVVFAASEPLAEYLSPCSRNVTLLPNGVNYALFAQEYQPVNAPAFCFVGTLYPDTDLSPLLYAAREKPEWQFTLVGGIEDDGPKALRHLERLPNVRLLGRRPPLDIPELLSHASVCLNFLRTSGADAGIFPIRLYEYLATGKPIVSMLWPEQVETLADVVYGAHSEREFLRTCENALQEAAGFVTQRRREYAAGADWRLRAAQVQNILDAITS